jgi:hypothetical protein
MDLKGTQEKGGMEIQVRKGLRRGREGVRDKSTKEITPNCISKDFLPLVNLNQYSFSKTLYVMQ